MSTEQVLISLRSTLDVMCTVFANVLRQFAVHYFSLPVHSLSLCIVVPVFKLMPYYCHTNMTPKVDLKLCALILFMRPDSVPDLGAIQIIYLLTNVWSYLLVQKDSDHALKELAKICILADCTMVAAFTYVCL